jgi:hypothetical protein
LSDALWSGLAYAGRYGGQSLDVMMSMTVTDLVEFNSKVSDIVVEENRPRSDQVEL